MSLALSGVSDGYEILRAAVAKWYSRDKLFSAFPATRRVATRFLIADILYNLNRCARTRRSCVFDMSANMNGIAIRRGLSRGGESAIIQSSRWPNTVIEHVQPFSSGRPSPSIPALYIRGATMA